MKKIAIFCIPAHGHTNPIIPVASELVRRGNQVRFYSFDEFKDKIEASGAVFVSCSRFLPELTNEEKEALKKSSNTEMSIQDIRTTLKMDSFIAEEFKSFMPDVIYTDSVCFWGKLSALKYNIPMVVSTTTFAFNQLSSKYMKFTSGELADMIFGLPKISRELKTLKPYGYNVKSTLSLVRNDNDTDTIVYTSENYQPYSESFTDHYLFAGPSISSELVPEKNNKRPLVYISMGTVVNDKPYFYSNCIKGLEGMDADIIISCGRHIDPESFGKLPDNFKVFQYVDQLDILSRANVFLTHCGMNSVSESLYMATPMVFFPQTGEQGAVARRASEIGAGVYLENDSPEGIQAAIETILSDDSYALAAENCSKEFRSCPGPAGAAEFIETAPHTATKPDLLKESAKAGGRFRILFWIIAVAVMILFGIFVTWKYVWIIGVVAGIFSSPVAKGYQNKAYEKMAKKYRAER